MFSQLRGTPSAQMAGAGSGVATAVSQGSAGVMDHTETTKQGIAFGASAGAGDAPAPKKKWTGDGAAVEDSNMALVRLLHARRTRAQRG